MISLKRGTTNKKQIVKRLQNKLRQNYIKSRKNTKLTKNKTNKQKSIKKKGKKELSIKVTYKAQKRNQNISTQKVEKK